MDEKTPSPQDAARLRKDRVMMEARKMYMKELEQQLNRMKRLIQDGEGDDAGGPASRFYAFLHTVKGSAPVFGLDRIGAVAQEGLTCWEETEGDGGEASSRLGHDGIREAPELLRRLEQELQACLPEPDPMGEGKAKTGHRDAVEVQGSRILLIDDDRSLRGYLARRLALDGYEADEADGVSRALALLRERRYDLILLDLMMQPLPGYELFEILKEDPTLKWIPLIVLSGKGDVRDKVRCFRLGADDYVTKPFEYEELEARIRNLIKRTKTYEQMAFRDPLTGIHNRRYFDHQLEQELQRVTRHPAPLSIVFIDIDRFKRINDTYGHTVGDLVLQGLAYRLEQHLRAADLLARYGGEEFVAVMPGTEGRDALRVMEAILEQVRSAPVAYFEGEPFRITFSAGIAEWVPGGSQEEWIRRADQAMYAAKQQGRDRVLVYEADMEGASAAADPLHPPMPEPDRRKRLLIAEDDEILREILAAKFREQRVEILEADNGETALRLIREERPDAAIIDGQMPRMGGLELVDAVRSDPAAASLKILMLSGKSKRADIAAGFQSGADDFMAKPFSLLELELRVKRLLGM